MHPPGYTSGPPHFHHPPPPPIAAPPPPPMAHAYPPPAYPPHNAAPYSHPQPPYAQNHQHYGQAGHHEASEWHYASYGHPAYQPSIHPPPPLQHPPPPLDTFHGGYQHQPPPSHLHINSAPPPPPPPAEPYQVNHRQMQPPLLSPGLQGSPYQLYGPSHGGPSEYDHRRGRNRLPRDASKSGSAGSPERSRPAGGSTPSNHRHKLTVGLPTVPAGLHGLPPKPPKAVVEADRRQERKNKHRERRQKHRQRSKNSGAFTESQISDPQQTQASRPQSSPLDVVKGALDLLMNDSLQSGDDKKGGVSSRRNSDAQPSGTEGSTSPVHHRRTSEPQKLTSDDAAAVEGEIIEERANVAQDKKPSASPGASDSEYQKILRSPPPLRASVEVSRQSNSPPSFESPQIATYGKPSENKDAYPSSPSIRQDLPPSLAQRSPAQGTRSPLAQRSPERRRREVNGARRLSTSTPDQRRELNGRRRRSVSSDSESSDLSSLEAELLGRPLKKKSNSAKRDRRRRDELSRRAQRRRPEVESIYR